MHQLIEVRLKVKVIICKRMIVGSKVRTKHPCKLIVNVVHISQSTKRCRRRVVWNRCDMFIAMLSHKCTAVRMHICCTSWSVTTSCRWLNYLTRLPAYLFEPIASSWRVAKWAAYYTLHLVKRIAMVVLTVRHRPIWTPCSMVVSVQRAILWTATSRRIAQLFALSRGDLKFITNLPAVLFLNQQIRTIYGRVY